MRRGWRVGAGDKKGGAMSYERLPPAHLAAGESVALSSSLWPGSTENAWTAVEAVF